MHEKISNNTGKEKKERIIILSVLIALLLIAFAVKTTFSSAKYKTQQILAGTITYNVNSDYNFEVDEEHRIKNTGTTSVWVRAFVVCNRIDSQGRILFSDETFTITPGSGWTFGDDGAFYYDTALDREELTSSLVIAVSSDSDRTEEVVVNIMAEVIDLSFGDSSQAAFAAATGA